MKKKKKKKKEKYFFLNFEYTYIIYIDDRQRTTTQKPKS